jgi:glycosyltransferase involved in cell wall biosynthesis
MISIVIPVFNEAESLVALHQEITAVLDAEKWQVEIIFVDDGSTDDSWQQIEALAGRDSRVRGLKFRRNFGKATALDAAFADVKGEYVFTLDADLQDDPREIPRMLLKDGCELVTGWKRQRHDPWHKVFPSRVFNWLVGVITGLKLHDHNCGIKGYYREVLKELRLYGELHRFITVMAHARGFKVGEMEVNHRPRQHGHSKYGVRRFLHGLLDLLTVRFLTGYGDRPLHLLGFFGLLAFAIGLAGLGYLAVLWFMGHGPIGNRPLLFYSVAGVLLGAQMISFGMLAELVIWRAGNNVAESAIVRRTNRSPADVTKPVSEFDTNHDTAR